MKNSSWASAALCNLLVSFGVLGGCAGENGDSSPEGESERSPAVTVGNVTGALVSAIDCASNEQTAYVQGRASQINVIAIGGKAVTRATGHAFLRMQRAADAAGVSLALNSGFRTNAEQEYLYGCYQSGNCNNGHLAARPGFSNHQSGVAVDLTTSDWLAENAGRFGFQRTVPSESWHYEYSGADPGGPCNGGVTWESPRDGGVFTNGIWLKATAPKASRVVYDAGEYRLGESSDAAESFAVRYTFNQLGNRAVKATAYDAAGALLGSSTTNFRVTP